MAKKAEKIARQARIAVEKWREYFQYNINEYHRLHQFVLGKQWSDEEEDMLVKTLNKVPLQFNKLATLVNTLLGEQQQNTPQLEIVPLSTCDEETAQIRQMIIKDTMLSTDAKTVYQVAASQAFVGGYGAFIVDTDYSHDKSFDQDIVYRYLKDATRAYWDPGAEDINKTDGMCAGYLSRMTRAKFRSIYGADIERNILKDAGITQTEEEIALAVMPDANESPFTWNDGQAITIIDHYVRTQVKDTLYKLSNGRSINQQEMDELVESSREMAKKLQAQQMMMGEMAGLEEGMGETEAEMGLPFEGMQLESDAENIAEQAGEISALEEEFITLYDEGMPVRIEDSRPSRRSKIMHYKIAGDYVLDKSEFPSEDLPIIFMDQNSFYDKNGKQVCRPFIIDAVDAQRYLNYLGTQSAYILKVSRYDQFIGSKKNAQGLDTQSQWKDPQNVKGMLYYDESPSGAKPEQLRPPELSASLMQQYQRAIDDMYTSTGLYPTRMGQQGNEISGAAIDARTRQGSYSTYVAFNSVNRAITAGGKIVNQMVPRVYDSERVMSLMTPDKGRQNITINEQTDEYGEVIRNDLRKGSFEVRLQAGPSYEGQKAQALESLNMVLQANPQLLNIFADLYAENLPLVNTIEIKNRLKTIVPPEILQAGKTGQMPKEQQRIDTAAQAAMAEAQFKQEQIALKKQELEMKMQEHQSKAEMDRMKLEMDRLDIAAKLEEQKLRYMAEMDRTHSDNAISHADNITKLLISKHKERTNGNRNQ
jgi:hypothetical protein